MGLTDKPTECVGPNWKRQEGAARSAIGASFSLEATPAKVASPNRQRPLRLADITQAILDGCQPRDLTADKLLAHSRLPLAWHEQRTVLGFT